MSKCKDLILSVIKPWFPYDTNTFLPLPAVLTDDRIELNIPTSTLKTQELMFLWLWRSRGRSSAGINCLHWSYENLHHLPQLRYNLGCIYCTAQFQEDRFSKTENTMDSPCLPLCLAIMNDYLGFRLEQLLTGPNYASGSQQRETPAHIYPLTAACPTCQPVSAEWYQR